MWVAAATVVGLAGALGTVDGTTAVDATDSALFPTVLVAWTVHV
jgi:hypothetical protein